MQHARRDQNRQHGTNNAENGRQRKQRNIIQTNQNKKRPALFSENADCQNSRESEETPTNSTIGT